MRQNLIINKTMADGPGTWYEENFVPQAIALTSEQTRNAASPLSLKVTLAKGWVNSSGAPVLRSEFGTNTKDMPAEIWVGFSILFPADYKIDNQDLLFTQMQAAPDKGEGWGNPPFSMYLHGDTIITALRSNAQAFDALKVMPPQALISLGKVTPGKWLDVVYHIKWGWNNNGIVQIWLNNKKVVDKHDYSIGYNDVNNPYFKFGIYQWGIADSSIDSRCVYFANVRVGNGKATYNDVYPDRTVIATTTINRFYDGSTEVVDKTL
jgi:hypothetical protein